MAKKKHHHEEHPDERWLITYADVLTLLFVLFMVLFSMSVVNTGKFDQLKESLSKGFSPGLFPGGPSVLEQGPETPTSPVVTSSPASIQPDISGPLGSTLLNENAKAEQALETAQLEQTKQAVDKAIADAGLASQAKTTVDERGLRIQLRSEPFLFQPGSADLSLPAQRLLKPIAGSIRRLQNPVSVEGHTDSTPISTGRFPSNRDLGAGRASAVLGVLERYGLAHSPRNTSTSYADTVPIADNATAAGRTQNRRVEILVLRLQGNASG